jgi:hypothetical protein
MGTRKSLIKNCTEVGNTNRSSYIVLNYKRKVMTDKMYDDAYFASIVKELVKQVPNDNQLGNEVRRLVWKFENV